LDKEGEKITLLWVPEHMEISGNEKADEETKTALEDNGKILTTRPNQLDKKGKH
jgi:ribonuclease HI